MQPMLKLRATLYGLVYWTFVSINAIVLLIDTFIVFSKLQSPTFLYFVLELAL